MKRNRVYGQPYVWRYLDEIVGTGTFDDQSIQFASACGRAREWLLSARPPDFRATGSRATSR